MAVWREMGISFAHSGDEYAADTGVRDENLAILYDAGFKKIRVNLPIYTTETSDTTLRDGLRGIVEAWLDKASDTTCEWGYTFNGATATSTTWTTYSDNVKAIATWINDLGSTYVARFTLSVGNEEDARVDGTTLTVGTLRSNLKTLSTECKAIASGLKTSYSFTTAFASAWQTAGKGTIDYMGLNLYGSKSVFDTQITSHKTAFGSAAYLSEWNAHDNGVDDFASTALYDKEIARRYDRIRELGMPAYFFGYRFGSQGDEWSTRLDDGTFRSSWYILTAPRRLVSTKLRGGPNTVARNYAFFNGTNATIDCGDMTATEGVAALSVSYWIKYRDANSQSIVRKRVSNSNWSYILDPNFNSNVITYGVNTASNAASTYTNTTDVFDIDTWHLVTMVYDGTNCNLYLNGLLKAQTAITGTIAASTTNLYLGSNQGSSGFYKGDLDDVRIYTRALTAAEVLGLYNYVEPSSTDLEAWWKLDETKGTVITDSSGNAHTATAVNVDYRSDRTMGTRSLIAGSGSSLYFNGINSYVNVPDINNLDFGTGDFSVSCWFNAPSSADSRLIYKFNLGTTRGFSLHWGNTARKVTFLLFDTGGSSQASCVSPELPFDNWYMATAVRSGTTNSLYINGVLVASATGATADVSGASALRIGATITPDKFYKGYIDDVRIFGRALTVAEISALFQANTAPDGTSLAGWYKFDEGEGLSVADSSSNTNTATVVNAEFAPIIPRVRRIV